ncbi:MAG: carboxypeptidase-like regulatory domain-containing protein, partial [Ignavibacteriales bacterium]
MKNKFLNTLFILLLTAGIVHSQTFSISGKVTDSLSNPLQNVNIIVLETENGTSTDSNGEYLIDDLASGVYNIRFSFLGYESQIIKTVLENKPITINVILKELPVETEQVIIS